jgi:hypothetical protein
MFEPRERRRLLMVAVHFDGPVLYAAAAGVPLASTFVTRETGAGDPPKPQLLDRVRVAIPTRHYRRRTEMTYVVRIRGDILFPGKRHPAEMGPAESAQSLTFPIERTFGSSCLL